MDLANVLSGLIGVLVGALVGAGVTFYAQRTEHRHQGSIASRAVHAELAANVAEIRLLLTGDSMHHLVTHAWDLRSGDVARILPADEFYKVARAYALIPACRWVQEQVTARIPRAIMPDEQRVLEGALPDASLANEILRRRAWKDGEGPTLDGLM